MGFFDSLFGSSSSSTTNQSSQRDPWAPAIPTLNGILGQVNSNLGNTGLTSSESSALDALKNNSNAWVGQYAPQIGANAQGLLNGGGALGQSGNVDKYYQQYYNQTNPLASNTNYNPYSTPGFGDALNTLRDDITGQVNGQFAAAGRDFSGYNAQTLGRGLTQGLAPTIAAQYNQNVQNQQGAAQNLYNAGNNTAGIQTGLTQQDVANRQAGANAATQGLQASNVGANAALQAEAARRGIPVQALGLLTQIGVPIAGLGGTASGTSTTNSTYTPSLMSGLQGLFSAPQGGTSTAQGLMQGAAGLGSGLTAAASSAMPYLQGLLAFSDRRLKTDISQIGTTFDGQKIYRFRYLNTPNWQIGFMADEVEGATPEAVHNINGFKAVDYKLATDKSLEAA